MPRSPSRDRSDRFIGHRRYFRSWNVVEKWKVWLSGIAVFVVLVWATFSFARKSSLEAQSTHGPLASVHMAWETKCEACHDKAQGGWFDAHTKWNTFTCEKCHAAPTHHASIPQGDAIENCATCHHDHKGRENSLVRMTDSHCVRCHADLHSNRFEKKISNFATDHKEFKPLAIRISTIKFSHAQHLTPGMTLDAAAIDGWKVGQISDKAWLEKYRKDYPTNDHADTALVHLAECKSCHSLDATPNSNGQTFAPIKFEQACQACHLTSAPSMPTATKQVVDPFTLPHGKSIGEIRTWIDAAYSAQLQKQHPALAATPNAFDPKRKDPAVKAFQDDVKQATDKAMSFLEMQCKKCHEWEDNKTKPSNIPSVWMTHARFDHTAHKATDCKSCHPNAGARDIGNATDYEREPVNILGIESCKSCHSPMHAAPDPKTGSLGGIRHGCTDCHRFHGGDQPLHGRANPIRVPKKNEIMTVEEFLNGERRP